MKKAKDYAAGRSTSVETFHQRGHDPATKKAADTRMSNASKAMNSTSILHPIQFGKAVKERNAAVLNSREHGSGAKYVPPHGVT